MFDSFNLRHNLIKLADNIPPIMIAPSIIKLNGFLMIFLKKGLRLTSYSFAE